MDPPPSSRCRPAPQCARRARRGRHSRIASNQERAPAPATCASSPARPQRSSCPTARAASDRISEFTDSTGSWIVAVCMVSRALTFRSGAIGVYATNASTPLFSPGGRVATCERRRGRHHLHSIRRALLTAGGMEIDATRAEGSLSARSRQTTWRNEDHPRRCADRSLSQFEVLGAKDAG